MLIRAAQSLLFVVDVQERLAPAIDGGESAVARIAILVRAARRLGIPIVVTEQYPKGLGPTLPALAALLGEAPIFAKTAFCAPGEPGIAAAVAATGRRRIIACGMEAHVCVLQSALGFRALGYEVDAVADAVGSRRAPCRALALERMRGAGVGIVDTEMVLFEWLERAGTDLFRELSRLIK
jgi:nicotinamidase-related amidase